MLYNVYHAYDVDGGFGDAVYNQDYIATVEATEKEIEEFKKEWDKPRVYSRPYADLYEHSIVIEKINVVSIKDVVPYPPEYRDLPDCPEDYDSDE